MYLCFIDLHKAFDRIQLQDIINILYKRQIPTNLINVIKNIYTDNYAKLRIKGELSHPIAVEKGIRQGDSLSPLLFNLIMDEIINSVKNLKGYKMGNNEIKIACYADDVVLFAEEEDDLQRLLFQFNKTAKKYNMLISTSKTKSMTFSKEPIRCKLVIENENIEQVMSINYLGAKITSYGDLQQETEEQIVKANRIAGCLNNTIWRNKHLRMETKTRIYKGVIRPIMTYTAETRSNTARTKRRIETNEMKILRRINNKTLRDRIPSTDIRQACQITPTEEWIDKRRREWNNHINRMDQHRLVKVVRDKIPVGRRSVGRPKKRWRESL